MSDAGRETRLLLLATRAYGCQKGLEKDDVDGHLVQYKAWKRAGLQQKCAVFPATARRGAWVSNRRTESHQHRLPSMSNPHDSAHPNSSLCQIDGVTGFSVSYLRHARSRPIVGALVQSTGSSTDHLGFSRCWQLHGCSVYILYTIPIHSRKPLSRLSTSSTPQY